jgi:ABC-type branched-subunit amino acid transport system permease subunit
MTANRARLLGLGLLAVVVIALPFLTSSFRVGQFTQVIVYAIAILGLNLLVGYSGQISLGHGAFFALGAYACAILISEASLLQATASSGELPLTGYLAIPVLLLGLASLTAGIVLRRRSRAL